MKIGFLGAGSWGFCLAYLLASKGYQTISWVRDANLITLLASKKEHPHLPGYSALPNMSFTSSLEEALENIDYLVESVTSAGFRAVFEDVKKIKKPTCPIIITSKGIEQNTGLILSSVLLNVMGDEIKNQVTCLSGPSYAIEVIKKLPVSVVVSGYDVKTMNNVCELFTTPFFRVYPNSDLHGVAYGGALKNVIAIACGISEGLGLGQSTKAAIITRGLHEMRKLAIAQGCKDETLNGLSGLGDLCLTCSSLMSRNTRFGSLLAKGYSKDEAFKEIGMVVEGAYTSVSAVQLSKAKAIPMPITETVYSVLYEGMSLNVAIQKLMERTIKEEHL